MRESTASRFTARDQDLHGIPQAVMPPHTADVQLILHQLCTAQVITCELGVRPRGPPSCIERRTVGLSGANTSRNQPQMQLLVRQVYGQLNAILCAEMQPSLRLAPTALARQ